MSLFGSLFTGVSALNAQSNSLGMISNNIANVNTVGYKKNVANFSSMVTHESRWNMYSPGGVRSNRSTTINQQGILQQTGSTTDAAISGDGFFVVKNNPFDALQQQIMYTRAGNFSEDSRGYLRNANGFYLQGWKLDAEGNIPSGSSDAKSLESVDVSFLNGLTAPTTKAEMAANLDEGQDHTVAGPHFTRAITVYDTLGNAQKLQLSFTKMDPATDPNSWELRIKDAGGGEIDGNGVGAEIGPFTMRFTSSGAFDGAASGAPFVVGLKGEVTLDIPNIDWTNDSALQTIKLDLTDMSQHAADYNVGFVNQNGAELGLKTGVEIDREGYVIATFSNGLNRALYKLPVATFTNPNGLAERTGNVYVQSGESGDYNLREAGKGGAGMVAGSALEASNVDLAEEFSRMIITQRAYSAGTKVISTSDQMLQELLGMR